MIYKSFEVSNFKGIDKVVVDLSNNRISTLVGLNESGKTTIMEAINLFQKMIKGEEPDEQSLNKIRPKGAAFSGTIKISGSLLFEDEDKKEISDYWTSLRKEVVWSSPKNLVIHTSLYFT